VNETPFHLSFRRVSREELKLSPPQPPEVAAAVGALLAEGVAEPERPDPWWREGIEASLNP
jgi:hypothetical protein